MSSKITFSLLFVLMLALVAGPAFAQVAVVSGYLNHSADTNRVARPANDAAALQSNQFVVYQKGANLTNPNDFIDANVVTVSLGIFNETFPDVMDLFRFGGTIELLLLKGDALTAGSLHRLVITEVMWGIDEAQTHAIPALSRRALSQWIEIYNAGAALKSTDRLRLLFTSNQRLERDEVEFKVRGVNLDVGTGTYTASTDADATTVTYTVVDRVSVVNRFGRRWAPKGQSGRTAVGPNGEPITNLVSMYRKRSTNDTKTGYKYKANGDPDGDKFGDGTDGGQWIASVGRINMSGKNIGTPGAVQQDDGGIATQAKAPASLPAGSVIINEIFNSDGLQWVELHNTGAAAVNVKNLGT